jgi:prepilin-type N-terminal cleavage/methylation domain-containing protein/prepilin-type processing-associated H-X9-DG protein
LKQRHAAFTLIELLVVMSIIALLVAILLPSLQSARKAADLVDCANRMRQCTMAMLTYVNDNKEVWPTQYGPVTVPATSPRAGQFVGGQEYRRAIASYTGIESPYSLYNTGKWQRLPMICKASDAFLFQPTVSYWAAAPVNGESWADFASYGSNQVSFFQINPYFGATDLNYKTRRGYPKNPSLTFALADGYREARPNYWYVSGGIGMFRFRHFESAPRRQDGIMNMSYIDGHVKGWKFSTTSDIYPTGGNGLWSQQRGFYWWNGTGYDYTEGWGTP